MEKKLEEFITILMQSGMHTGTEQIDIQQVSELTKKVLDSMKNPKQKLDEDSVLFETRIGMLNK